MSTSLPMCFLEVFKHDVVLECASQQPQVLEVDRAQVDFSVWGVDSSGDGVRAAGAQRHGVWSTEMRPGLLLRTPR